MIFIPKFYSTTDRWRELHSRDFVPILLLKVAINSVTNEIAKAGSICYSRIVLHEQTAKYLLTTWKGHRGHQNTGGVWI